jgi:L-arabinose isomerase
MNAVRIAVIGGYMPFFDPIMPTGYRAGRDAFVRQVAELLQGLGQIDYLGLVDSFEAGAAAGRAITAQAADMVVVVPSMACPAGYIEAALVDRPDLPVVIAPLTEIERIPRSYDMPDLCHHSGHVGALMAANILHRAGRRPSIIAGPLGDPSVRARLMETVRAAALAGRFRKLRVGRLGRPLDGYGNVDLDEAIINEKLGITLVSIEHAEWVDVVCSVTVQDREKALEFLGTRLRWDGDAASPDLAAALNVAVALDRVVDRHGLDAGAINCRGEWGVTEPRIASLACLGLTAMAARGVPFACTGDVSTAIALWLGRQAGGAALYCELDAVDIDENAFLCSNTGEADPDWLAEGACCSAFPAGGHSGRPSPGCCLSQRLRTGPATMVGFSPDGRRSEGFVLCALEGEVTGTPQVALPVTSAWFRPHGGAPYRSFEAWAGAGATHHGSLSPGHLSTLLADVACHAGIAFEPLV